MKLTLNIKRGSGRDIVCLSRLIRFNVFTTSEDYFTVQRCLDSCHCLMGTEPLITIWTSERGGCWWSRDPQETQTVNIIVEATNQKTELQWALGRCEFSLDRRSSFGTIE